MQNFFGVEVDTASMTTEELKEAEIEIRKMYANIKHQLSFIKKIGQTQIFFYSFYPR